MNKIIYLIILVCLLIIFNIKDELKLYYIQYNPIIININGYYVHSKYKNELYDKNNNIIFICKVSSLINNSQFNFIYKIDNIYEPIYYFNEEQLINDDKMVCDISFNLHSDKDINTYINNILYGIENKINEIYRIKYLDINLFCVSAVFATFTSS